MKNPIKLALEDLGQTQQEFAFKNGLSFSTLRMVVSGRLTQIPTEVKNALFSSDVNTQGIEEDYLRFRVWKAKEDLRLFQKRRERLRGEQTFNN